MATHQRPPVDTLIGKTIGNYLVTQRVGEGGMGAVYLAEHPTIGKKVAIKVLHSEFSTNPDVANRFFNEAKAVNDIGHPNIVDIVDFGLIQSGTGSAREQLVYFIMEYLAGQTLSAVVRSESPLPPARALAIALQVGDALAASHKCGIVHRDLKPDNIILISRHRDRDFVKLLDFGIAKLTNDAQSNRTRTGIVMGTPAYMSPEQCEGRGSTDHRTDIYALGIVLYEMLTGRVPFIGEAYGDILIQHLTQQPRPPSQYHLLNPHVEAVVMKALEKRPDLRYPTMDEFIRAMADPVGYVEAYGGIAAFMARQLMPSSAPLPSVRASRITGAPPMMVPTPAPGAIPMLGAHGHALSTPGRGLAPPTTMGAAAGQQLEPPRSKVGFIIAAAIVVASAAVGIGVVAMHRDAPPVTPAVTSARTPAVTAMAGPGSGSGRVAAGSANVAVGSGSGSAAVVPDVGSASVVAEVGSAAVVADAGSGSGSSAIGAGSGSGSGSAATVARLAVTLRTKPAGAHIWVEGRDTGAKTPDPVQIDAGKRVKIVLRLSGYRDVSITSAGDVAIVRDVTLVHTGGGTAAGSAHSGANDTSLMPL